MIPIIGLFGLAGSGKTSISNIFQQYHWEIINMDMLGHQVLDEHPMEIQNLFGSGIVENETVNRKKLGQKVFSDSVLLKKLMNFSYPYIIEKTNAILQQNRKPVIIEGALFCLVKDKISYTHLMYVSVEIALLCSRLHQRGHSLEWIQNVLANQKIIFDYLPEVDFFVDNNGTLDELYTQIIPIINKFL